jgi:adenylyltransferase/sulfurtransferase
MQPIKNITPVQLKELIDNQTDFQLIDTREAYEHADFNIGGVLFPLAEITKHLGEIETEKPVVVYCRAGVRSQIAIQRLLQKFPFQNLYNLTGGTEAWKTAFGNQ